MTDRNEPTGRMDGAHSATTPDMSRVALEALAERLARYSVRESNALEDDLLQAAATLRALAVRAEPPADVAALVEEAQAPLSREEWIGITDASNASYRLWSRRATQDARAEDSMEWHRERAIAAAYAARVSRLAAALTAQAERADRAEEARRIAALEIAGKHLAVKLAEANANPADCQALRDWLSLMPARAALAKTPPPPQQP